MPQPQESPTNKMLGYPDDARLLIVNADDFGMCHAVNTGIWRCLEAGVVRSTTLMVPCPWALHAMDRLRQHPEVAFGIHLTVICDSPNYAWRPLSSGDFVPSLVNEAGYFYTFDQMRGFLEQVNLEDLEREFTAQIEAVLASGLEPTHLDWHSLRLGRRTDIFELMRRLALEYGLALRVMNEQWIADTHSRGFPCNDYDFLDSSMLPPQEKPGILVEMLRELPEGLTEWAAHPGVENDELRAIEPTFQGVRQADLDFFTSPEAREVIRQEGIVLLDYKPLQAVWRGK